MTTKAAFTEAEWDLIRSAPMLAGMTVAMSERGGLLRETMSMGKAYTDARREHGNSELLDEIVATRPERDHTRVHSYEELKTHSTQVLREAVATLTDKATPAEVDDYRGFVLALARRVAERHEEHDRQVSEREQAALDELATALGSEETP